MAGSAQINGTSYTVSGGRTIISGTGYDITAGKTMAGGTVYGISFAQEAEIELIVKGDATQSYTTLIIGDQTYSMLNKGTFRATVQTGDVVTVKNVDRTDGSNFLSIYINDEPYDPDSTGPWPEKANQITTLFQIDGDTQIEFSSNLANDEGEDQFWERLDFTGPVIYLGKESEAEEGTA